MSKTPINCKTTDHEQTYVSFDQFDSRGRVIGAYINFFTEECTVIEGELPRYGYRIGTPGTWYCFRGKNARNGMGFGSSNATHRFKTTEERAAYAEKFVKSSRRRMAKKYGGIV